MSDNLRGALTMTAAMLFFLINDSCMKALSSELPLFQSIAIRGFGTLVVLTGVVLVRRPAMLWPSARDRWLILVRTAGEAMGAFTFIAGLYHLPIANANAILQALPLAVTLAGALFLGEPVGWRRLSAILIGFAGVMLIIQPGGEGFSIYALYPLSCVFAVVVRDLATRGLSPEVPSILVAVAAALGVTVSAGLLTLTEDWAPITPRAAALLGGAIFFVILGYIFSIMTMRVGDIAFVAPFRYTGLIFSLIAGMIVFGEMPDAFMLAGSALVVATGLFTFWRERYLARPTGPAPLRIR